MRRWAMRIFVFMLLGAIVNVAVAWGCSIWSNRFTEYTAPGTVWPIPPPHDWPSPKGRVWGFVGFGYKDANALIDAPEGVNHNQIRGGSLAVFMAGWPSLALYAERHRLEVWTGLYGPMGFSNPQDIGEGIAIPPTWSDWHTMRCLPTRPLWPGFAINTIFYAAVLWMLFAFPFALRRRRRIKRGLCPNCAYDLRNRPSGSAACPECGSA